MTQLQNDLIEIYNSLVLFNDDIIIEIYQLSLREEEQLVNQHLCLLIQKSEP